MKILIAGSTGSIGTPLCAYLQAHDCEVSRLVRPTTRLPEEIKENLYFWDPETGKINPHDLASHDVVINLCSADIYDPLNKDAGADYLLASRVNTTKLLAETIDQLSTPPKLFLNASSIVIYGETGSHEVDENHAYGHDSFASFVTAWEKPAQILQDKPSVRLGYLRFGSVLYTDCSIAGMIIDQLKQKKPAILGSGEQYIAWTMMDDVIRAIHWIIMRDELQGGININAPHPVQNKVMAESLSKVLQVPMHGHATEMDLLKQYGEFPTKAALASYRVIPAQLLRSGFKFEYDEVFEAVQQLLRGL